MAKTAHRKARDSKVPDTKLLRPFDVTKFGGDDDPCFGKLYSLTDDECLYCGDNELCGIAYMNTLNRKRISYEKENPVLDVEIDALEKEKDVKEFVTKLRDKGFKNMLVKRRVKQRFRMTDEVVTKYI